MIAKVLLLCALGALLFSGRTRLPRLVHTLRGLPDELRAGRARAERPQDFARDITPPHARSRSDGGAPG